MIGQSCRISSGGRGHNVSGVAFNILRNDSNSFVRSCDGLSTPICSTSGVGKRLLLRSARYHQIRTDCSDLSCFGVKRKNDFLGFYFILSDWILHIKDHAVAELRCSAILAPKSCRDRMLTALEESHCARNQCENCFLVAVTEEDRRNETSTARTFGVIDIGTIDAPRGIMSLQVVQPQFWQWIPTFFHSSLRLPKRNIAFMGFPTFQRLKITTPFVLMSSHRHYYTLPCIHQGQHFQCEFQSVRAGFATQRIPSMIIHTSTRFFTYSSFADGVQKNSVDAPTVNDVLVYAKHDSPKEALIVIDKRAEEGIFPGCDEFNTVVQAYAREGHVKGIHRLMQRMKRLGISPDAATFESLFHAYRQTFNMRGVEAAWEHMLSCNIAPTKRLYSAFIQLLVAHKQIESAEYFYNKMEEEVGSCYITLAEVCRGYCAVRDVVHAERMFRKLKGLISTASNPSTCKALYTSSSNRSPSINNPSSSNDISYLLMQRSPDQSRKNIDCHQQGSNTTETGTQNPVIRNESLHAMTANSMSNENILRSLYEDMLLLYAMSGDEFTWSRTLAEASPILGALTSTHPTRLVLLQSQRKNQAFVGAVREYVIKEAAVLEWSTAHIRVVTKALARAGQPAILFDVISAFHQTGRRLQLSFFHDLLRAQQMTNDKMSVSSEEFLQILTHYNVRANTVTFCLLMELELATNHPDNVVRLCQILRTRGLKQTGWASILLQQARLALKSMN
eukprot:gene2435-5375_t